jgi:hypothetical protein
MKSDETQNTGLIHMKARRSRILITCSLINSNNKLT